MKFNNTDSEWKFLDEFRGKDFNGTWPTLVEMFNISTKRYPDNPCFSAITPKKESFTYSEAHSIITKLGNYLVRLGVKKGDRIAVTGKNSPQWAIAYLGILYSGAIVVPIDYSLHASEIEHLLEFAGVKMLFIDKERIEEIDSDNKLGLLARFSLEEGDMNHKFILDCQEDEDLNREKVTESDTAAILFTSGTTGTPKGVMLSHGNFVSDCYIAQSQMHLYPTDVFYAILPIHHAYTMLAVLIETISVGASCLFGKKLVISQVLRELKEGKVTMFLGVPMLFNKMIAALMKGVREKGILAYCFIRMGMGLSGFIKKVFHVNVGKKWFGFLLKRLSLDTSRICICGGGPLPSSTFKLFNELGIDFVQGYGLTEASPITHLNPVEHFIVTSVGRAFPGEEVKIVNPDSEGNGIIFIKGPNVMQGYYHNREATDAVLDKDGWLNTGDVGHQDENRFLYLTGREKNIIVTEGGKNVFPEEIEDRFQLYDDIETICIMGYMVDKATRSEGIRAL
ncbi:MAG: class I adenylate-forming enzyme family protein, partial [Sphaerochaetaceae bacterium]